MTPLLRTLTAAAAVLVSSLAQPLVGCTNILVTKGASKDGSTMIAYSADSHTLYGELYYKAAGLHLPGELRDIVEWDTGKFLGRIKEAPVTYARVGNMNERQVSIGETTFGGRKELQEPAGIVDYGSLMYIALERARTAREAIQVMADLVAEYGYASEGESISVADPNEAWIFEIIGKGKGQKGAVWVAVKLPDGTISSHANHARISTFPLNEPQNCLYAKDVIEFARKNGWYKGADKDFSFTDVYAPADFGALRFCEARVWSVFHRAAPSLKIPADIALGKPGARPMPLWIKPDQKLAVRDVMELMRDHYEGTELDMSKDVGAGPYHLPYRWRPMEWKSEGKDYLHERAISTQQTGWSFVSQSRAFLPDPVGGVLWFGVDDTFTTVYVPMYCAITSVPRTFAEGTGSWNEFSWDSAFWTFNFVSNYAYTRWDDMIVDVQKVQRELEGGYFARQAEIEAQALALYRQNPLQARAFLTDYSCRLGDQATARWKKLGEFLIWKYLDGNVRDAKGQVTHPAYAPDWYKRIVQDKGEDLKIPAGQAGH
ncbi:dipeptidase [Mesoterricola sediminis]|uniref:Dipeptidase n=1 Tax=Mesoterricola sediminis TaxID=2927980 RepID=A0AA48GY66_9BACT|nr:C69 family dipeptidase [Mesoterricola sediminis]BDU77785.1 peptidase C69 [Mesoterricola sediminis]